MKRRVVIVRFLAFAGWYTVVCTIIMTTLFFLAFNFDSLRPQIEAQTSELLDQKVRIRGSIEPGVLDFHPALVMHKVEIGANIKADTVTVAMQSKQPLLKVLVHADGLEFKKQPLGNYDIPVTAYPPGNLGGFEIEPLKGKLSGAAFSGKVKYLGKDLHIDGDAKDVPLARLAEEAEGKVDIKFQLDSKGDTTAQFIRALGGRVTLTSGSGKLTSKSLNFWSRDLLRNFLPGGGDTTTLNCAIIDFDIAKGVAASRALIVDTDENTIIGKGRVDLDKETVDLYLKPNPKDISLVNFTTPVHVTGPFNNTVVAPQTTGMLKKIGGVVLDVVNPAFALLPMLETSLGEYHGTCADIIKQRQLRKKS
jgi:uncharacterized protein involved in outer membrane biogenesis